MARQVHGGNDANVERYDPDLWTDEFAFALETAADEIAALVRAFIR